MHPDFWHERWTSNQIGFHREAVNPLLEQYWPALCASPGCRVFVPLCGKSRDLPWLRAQGHEVVGVELSALAVRDFFQENGLQPTVRPHGAFELYQAEGIQIYCGDFFHLSAAELAGVGAVFDRAALVALPPEMRAAYAAHLRRLLAPRTRILLVTFEYPQDEMAGPPFSVPEQEVHALFGGNCALRPLHDADILQLEPRFQEKGLSRLHEKVYALTYNGVSQSG